MGNCATNPKVLTDSDEAPAPAPAPAPVPDLYTASDQPREAALEAVKEDPAEERKSDKGKEIVVEGDDGEEQIDKRRSLSHLFKEDEWKETMEKEETESETVKVDVDKQTGPSEEQKPEASVPEVSVEKLPEAKPSEIPSEQTPKTPDFVEAPEKFESEKVIQPKEKETDKENAYVETKDLEEVLIKTAENKQVSMEKQTEETPMETQTKDLPEEKQAEAANPEVAK